MRNEYQIKPAQALIIPKCLMLVEKAMNCKIQKFSNFIVLKTSGLAPCLLAFPSQVVQLQSPKLPLVPMIWRGSNVTTYAFLLKMETITPASATLGIFWQGMALRAQMSMNVPAKPREEILAMKTASVSTNQAASNVNVNKVKICKTEFYYFAFGVEITIVVVLFTVISTPY